MLTPCPSAIGTVQLDSHTEYVWTDELYKRVWRGSRVTKEPASMENGHAGEAHETIEEEESESGLVRSALSILWLSAAHP
jgi:hypothetical protein